LLGRNPDIILDQHPGGEFIAMQVGVANSIVHERAAVWKLSTRKIVWTEEDVVAVCWSSSADEIFVLRGTYERSPEHPGVVVTPLQRELSYSLEKRSWPALLLIARTPVKLPTGWPVHLAAVPRGTFVCCLWVDQSEAGVEFFSPAAGGISQVSDAGYYGASSNLIHGPFFTPNGQFMLLTYGRYAWWNDSADSELPSRGGRHKVGWIVVGKLLDWQYQVLEVNSTLPLGWCPKDPDALCNEIMSGSFVDGDRFRLTLPTGETRDFAVPV
jgi:hypothetical protein